ncbi:unannotated protein [freshwater metagenome]|uniref:Unannotated protein n=1 Tax=freshwater metagenome TaxID=449393 RepID=A0A6J6CR18_9ZZZZ
MIFTSGVSKGARASTARRRIAGLSPQAAMIASRPNSFPIAPRAATDASRTRGSLCIVVSSISLSRTACVTTSCSPHDHAAISTTSGSSSLSRGSKSKLKNFAPSSATLRRTRTSMSVVKTSSVGAVRTPKRSKAPSADSRTDGCSSVRPISTKARSPE